MSCSFLQAIGSLLQGEMVAFPTDTVYGLGVSLLLGGGGESVFKLKQRDPNKPLVVYVNEISTIETIIQRPLSPREKQMAYALFPKPVTLIVNHANPCFPTQTIGFRIVNHPMVHSLIQHAGPLLATSANRSNTPSSVSFHEVQEDFQDEIMILIGECTLGLESTVLDTQPLIYREGAVSKEEIERCLGEEVSILPPVKKCYSDHLQIHTVKDIQALESFLSQCQGSYWIEEDPEPLRFYPLLRKAIRDHIDHLIFVYDDHSHPALKPFLSPYFIESYDY